VALSKVESTVVIANVWIEKYHVVSPSPIVLFGFAIKRCAPDVKVPRVSNKSRSLEVYDGCMSLFLQPTKIVNMPEGKSRGS